MFSEHTVDRLNDIVENIDVIDDYVRGMSRDELAADRKTRDAVERCLQRITEAVIQIGVQDMGQIAPSLPHRDVRNMGNVLRHGYRRIDLDMIWETIRDDLPSLRAAAASALDT